MALPEGDLDRTTLASSTWYAYSSAQRVRFPSAGRFTLFLQVRDKGGAVLLVSEDLDELLELDRKSVV